MAAGRRSATSRTPLTAYETNPIWTSDPKHTPYRDSVKNMRPAGYAGKLGYASAGALADFIVVNMVAEARQRLEDAEGSGRAGAEARRALLQGLTSRASARRIARDVRGRVRRHASA